MLKCFVSIFLRVYFLVSHTDHDLIFIWNMTDPLVVNPDIELPQLDISNNYTTDCTIEYSTGKSLFFICTYFFTSTRYILKDSPATTK